MAGGLYIQWSQSVKATKPLCHIHLRDVKESIHVHIQNKGMGPMILDEITFMKNGVKYNEISECLNLNPKSYGHNYKDSSIEKKISAQSYLVLFEKNITNLSENEIKSIREQLSAISVIVKFHDINNKKYRAERNLEWFSRHIINDKK